MIVEVVLVAGGWLLLGLAAGRATPLSVVLVAIGGALAVMVSMSPMLFLVVADLMLSSPGRQDPREMAWATGAVMGSLVGAPTALLCWITAPPPARPQAELLKAPAAPPEPPARFRRTGRVEPPVAGAAAPVTPVLSPERMAEIEAEERYRAEIRARLAAERGAPEA